jgi:predicted metal-binding membrane protein
VSERSALEAALIRDRWVIGGALALAIALSWLWIVPMARDMYGAMRGSAAWMMPPGWDAWHDLLLFAMWLVMMAGMMLPSAAPTFLLYAAVLRHSPDGQPLLPRVYAFAAGYLTIWTGFSLLATVLQRLLAEALVLSPMMDITSPVLGGALLIAAGLYQLTPFKRSCLESCQSPAAFIAGHWQRGRSGAFRMGLKHGLFCLGCCWLLMLLLFVGGVMNLVWIAAITVFVLVEKMLPAGKWSARSSGVLLIAAGLWCAVVPLLKWS